MESIEDIWLKVSEFYEEERYDDVLHVVDALKDNISTSLAGRTDRLIKYISREEKRYSEEHKDLVKSAVVEVMEYFYRNGMEVYGSKIGLEGSLINMLSFGEGAANKPKKQGLARSAVEEKFELHAEKEIFGMYMESLAKSRGYKADFS